MARSPARPTAATARNGAARALEPVDTSYLEGLIGYNARRAALAVIAVFMERMAPYQLKPVEFSVLSLVAHNPGITSSQLCASLGILAPNLVAIVAALEKRDLITREPHPRDGRALGLHLTAAGRQFAQDAERTATQLEAEVAARLSATESRTLIRLLKKVYA